MLKEDFDTIHQSFKNWLFKLKVKDLSYRSFGLHNSLNNKDLFISSALLDYIKVSNKTINPKSTLRIPKSVNLNDFNRVISNIKNDIL